MYRLCLYIGIGLGWWWGEVREVAGLPGGTHFGYFANKGDDITLNPPLNPLLGILTPLCLRTKP